MLYRLRQVAASLASRDGASVPAELAGTPRTARLFAALAPHDRRHLLAVHRACVAEELSPDVAMAGLLHDVAKASLSGRRVTLLERSVRVVLARWRPTMLCRLCGDPASAWRKGLALAEGHPAIGAERLAALGWPEAIVVAVRDHEADVTEGGLATLRRIDDAMT